MAKYLTTPASDRAIQSVSGEMTDRINTEIQRMATHAAFLKLANQSLLSFNVIESKEN